ncbi:MAG: hypothetical protein NC318_12715 [Blautia sp.]|nr:hypothetical protein [Lachnoclostridium sp.]MCM1212453.1 hypothetical protein [Blautia sp.]
MKKVNVLLCGIGIACILTGCGNTMPELTEEENDIITEYAVGLLLKYDKNYNSRLIDLAAYEEEQDVIRANAEAAKEQAELEEAAKEAEEESEIADTEIVNAGEETEASTIEEFYGIDGFSFQYMGYDLKTEYPENAGDEAEAFFAMEATPGMQLVILKFMAINQTGAATELNMLNYNTKLRVTLNGETSKAVLSTMLLNDIQNYKGTLDVGGSTELVAVAEVPEGTYIENVSLVLRNDSDSATIPLQ